MPSHHIIPCYKPNRQCDTDVSPSQIVETVVQIVETVVTVSKRCFHPVCGYGIFLKYSAMNTPRTFLAVPVCRHPIGGGSNSRRNCYTVTVSTLNFHPICQTEYWWNIYSETCPAPFWRKCVPIPFVEAEYSLNIPS